MTLHKNRKQWMDKSVLLLLFNLVVFGALGQNLSGYIQDDENNPVAFASVYIKDVELQTVADGDGKYFIAIDEGEYEVVFRAMGYKDKTVTVVIRDKDVVKNVWLEVDAIGLEETVVKAKRRDPAYEIMQNAVRSKKRFQQQYNSLSQDIYIKAVEDIDEKELKKRKRKAAAQDADTDERLTQDEDGLKEDDKFEKKKPPAILFEMNMAEVNLTRHSAYPDKVKEIRRGIKKLGSMEGLYYLNTLTEDFNFYQNLLQVQHLSETPLISPLNDIAVLNYKFTLLETYSWENQLVHRIRVTPRRKGNSTVDGIIEIVDGVWAIKSLDFTLEKGNLKGYDRFNIKQGYNVHEDSIWLLNEQVFAYETDTRKKKFKGITTVGYDNYVINPEFDKRFFNNEVGVVEMEAYERDSSYWENIRPVPLTKEERRYQEVKDSIEAALNKKEYLDSVDKEFNRVTWAKVLYWGVGKRNRAKKVQWDFGSLLNYIEPVQMGGFRVDPYFSYFKKWKDERYLTQWAYVSYGFRNEDVTGEFSTQYMYDAMRRATVFCSGGVDYEPINPYGSFMTGFQMANYYRAYSGRIGHVFELFNGFYLRTVADFQKRTPLTGYDFGYIGDLSDLIFGENSPEYFDPYEALRTTVTFTYTPAQRYVREPYRKVVLGSKYPTFYVSYNKGWKGVLDSDVDFDQLTVGMTQTFNISTLGTSKYNISAGKFLNETSLKLIDYKFFRQSEPFLYSNPLRSFQVLDSNMSTTNFYLEGHYIHHFNGALLNNMPLIRKLRLKTVAGAGLLWVQDSNYQHAELSFGVERIFRALRRRFRLGMYGVVGGSNYGWSTPAVKFSIEFYNNREGKWRF